MADIRKRGKAWQARIDYYDDNGKRHFKSKTGFKSKHEAQVFISQMIVDKSSGQFIPDVQPLFYDYFWRWFKTYKEKTITDRTKQQYVHTLNVLKKYLPSTLLSDMNREKYQKFLDEYGSNHAKETISKINALVHACVKDAIYDGDLKKDFVQRTHLVYDKDKTWKVDYLNGAEMKQLTSHLINTRNHHYASKYMILLAIYTGMRLGEIQGLKWSDINMDFKTISIKRSWNSLTKEYIPVKTESSKRIIRVSADVLNIISELKANHTEAVFTNQFGTIPTSNAVNKTLKESLRKLGIKKQGFHFHSLRHTHVAYLLANNVDIYVISKRLGHSDIGITKDTKKDASVN
ncbi:site-specific integrase [Fructilactobacillus hinvesii]|uniref:Site-specific integrase n=1 Tax=Fructilactobacillus hinvesii TaxID=2940300 RepID=A0ABY5BUG2_9LACO|nr:site-specific integrase [Fructilactobacillus hinvesii]USS87636.1 site-specific integrase [Fructilactobacillus hinvesii]